MASMRLAISIKPEYNARHFKKCGMCKCTVLKTRVAPMCFAMNPGWVVGQALAGRDVSANQNSGAPRTNAPPPAHGSYVPVLACALHVLDASGCRSWHSRNIRPASFRRPCLPDSKPMHRARRLTAALNSSTSPSRRIRRLLSHSFSFLNC